MQPIKAEFKTILKNAAATDAFGHCLGRQLVAGLIVYLHGDLGAGKTALTRALLHAAGYSGHVKSPTYTLAESYQIIVAGQSVTLMHFDLYRMADPEEFLDAGFREVFNGSTICIVEWPENGSPVLPAPDLQVYLSVFGEGRQLKLCALTAKGHTCLEQLHFAPNL